VTRRGEFEWIEDLAEVALIALIVTIGLVGFSVVALREWTRRW
jgi:hypothetical protein